MMSPTKCAYLAKADAVFEGTVERIEIAKQPPPAGVTVPPGLEYLGGLRTVVTFKDVKAWRGDAQTSIVTGSGGGDCGYPFEVGTRYLIEAGRLPDGRLTTGLCGNTRPIDGSEAVIEYLKSLNGAPTQRRIWGSVITISEWTTARPVAAPVANRRITIDGPKRVVVSTDARGSFAVTDLPPGTYRVSADVRSSQRDASQEFMFTPADRYACAEVMLIDEPAGAIAGTVIDDAGKPVGGQFIELTAADVDRLNGLGGGGLGTETDESGNFEFGDLPPGRYKVGINVWSGPSTVARGPNDESTIVLGLNQTIKLAPLTPRRFAPIKISGRIVDSDGAPVSGISVHPKGINEDGTEYWTMPKTSDSEGAFSLELHRGERYVAIVGPSRAPLAEYAFIAAEAPLLIRLKAR